MNRAFSKIITIFLVFTACFFAFPVNALVPNDFFLGSQWYLDRISVYDAWDITTGSPSLIVAVLDSGVDLDHPDLVGNLWVNTGEISGDGIDNDRNGFEDDYFGWDFVDGDSDPRPHTEGSFQDAIVSHGTLVSGMIGALSNNELGVSGLNWNVRIMPIRILNEEGIGSSYDVRHAIRYAVENGADVINLSFTASELDPYLFEEIKWAYEQGVVIVTSVGNENINLLEHPVYPACYDLNQEENYIIGVAATNKLDQKADFSNYGSGCVDVSAPGTTIFGMVYHDPQVLLLSTLYGGPWEGTSVAAPIVTGIVALMKAAEPSLSPQQILLALRLSTNPIKESALIGKSLLGSGIVNASLAIQAAHAFAQKPKRLSTTPLDPEEALLFSLGTGSPPLVYFFDKNGEEVRSFLAYDRQFTGGVSLAKGDLDGDGHKEIIVGAGSGGGPQVRIFDMSGQVLSQFFAFDEQDRSGIQVKVGDVNADGKDEIIATSYQKGNGLIKIFDKDGLLLQEIDRFQGSVTPLSFGVGNIDAKEGDELVVYTSQGTSTFLMSIDETGDYIGSFPVFIKNTGSSPQIEVVDIDGDHLAEILVSEGIGANPRVFIYSSLGVLQKTFLAYEETFLGGVMTATGDLDHNQEIEIYTIPTSTGGSQLRVFNQEGEVIDSLFLIEDVIQSGSHIAL
ncbi:hypothetical protein A2239_02615 [Candidatus Uhrbacteria bacterium RIFOXYA2_FULL_40_9]|nr:MAG: hypothetical protein A2239_02615 [Candidatus Uhrbacteria bacterium RIFOXYA2_FULL_40_9]OGL96572.1 MAG: hypothetical protein A2332_00050 [Candidatus Uhrbacteria bacterium RIFOXYB2_FULL_41_18]